MTSIPNDEQQADTRHGSNVDGAPATDHDSDNSRVEAGPSAEAVPSGGARSSEEAEPSGGGSSSTEAEETHRGAFGEFGGETSAFIERTFRERIVIVGVNFPPFDEEAVAQSLDELELLVNTADADVVARVVQRREHPDPATYIGRGKVDEIRRIAEFNDCDTVVFDDELSPAQQFNLEKLLGRTAIDRTAVILDIFAQNARSQEGKAQVQLAMYRYRLPRLRSSGATFSQQAGGVGTRRGPGETQLEIDRRRIMASVHRLESELRSIARHRDTQRKSRKRSKVRQVVLVGYTNAGKSTLLNRLTEAGVLVEDKLFATLDATTRQMNLPGGERILLTDTVGFIRKLPHQLVEAFASTLDVVNDGDLLVHIVDGSSPDPEGNIDAVREVISEIGGADIPELLVINKADCGSAPRHLARAHPGSVLISARSGLGLEELVERIGSELRSSHTMMDLFVPYKDAEAVAALHRCGDVLAEDPLDEGMRMRVRVPAWEVAAFDRFVVDHKA